MEAGKSGTLDGNYLIDTGGPTFLTIGNIISISLKDGSVTHLPGYTTADAAASEFWEAVGHMFHRRECSSGRDALGAPKPECGG